MFMILMLKLEELWPYFKSLANTKWSAGTAGDPPEPRDTLTHPKESTQKL